MFCVCVRERDVSVVCVERERDVFCVCVWVCVRETVFSVWCGV